MKPQSLTEPTPSPADGQLQAAQSVAQEQEPLPEIKPDWSEFASTAPTLARHLEDNADFALGVKDHAPWLAALEEKLRPNAEKDGVWEFRLKSALANDRDALSDIWKDIKGSFSSEKGAQELYVLRAKEVMGTATDSDLSRADELSAQHQPWSTPNTIYGSFLAETPGKAAGMLGAMLGNWKPILADTATGATMGATLGSVAPGAGTVAGLGVGATVGLTAGLAEQQAVQTMGSFYETMRNTKMPDGTPVNRDAARAAAVILGAVNGGLGALPLSAIFSKAGLTPKLLGRAGQEFMAQALANPVAQTALARLAVKFGTAEFAQAAVGVIQELATMGAEKGVFLATDPAQSTNTDFSRLPDAARNALQAGVPFSGWEAAAHGSAKSVAHYDNVGKVAQEVPLFQQDKVQLKNFLERLAEDNKQKTATFPRDKLEAALDEMGLHGEKLKTVLPDVARQLEETRGDSKATIQVSPADAGTYLATSATWKKLRLDMRDGNNFTLNELKELAKTTQQDLGELKLPEMPAKLKPIYEDVQGQLAKTRALGPIADKAATLYTSALNAIAQATGAEPKALHEKWGLQFVENMEPELDARAAGVPGATVESAGRHKILPLDKVIPAGETGDQNYLKALRAATGKVGDGTYGELFDHLSKTTGSPAAATRVLAGLGYDGLDTGKTKRVWAPDILIPRKDPLTVTRGRTQFEPGKTTVAFSQHANVATVAHELGHVFLRMWDDAATGGGAPKFEASFQNKASKEIVNTGPFHDLSQLPGGTNAHASGQWVDGFTDQHGKFFTRDEAAKALNTKGQELASGGLATEDLSRMRMADSAAKNLAALREFLGAGKEGPLTEKQQEKFARAFVDYLREGNAPSLALRPAFGSFKGWLTALYGTQTAMGGPVSPEVHQVFDRLLASRKAIEDAQKALYVPLFDPDSTTVPDAKFAKLKRAMDDAVATARDQNERELFSHMSAEGIDAFEKTRDSVRDELIATDSTHSLVSFLKDGERLDHGPLPLDAVVPLPGDASIIVHKLDTYALSAMEIGEGTLAQLQELIHPGGLDPTAVAETFGLDDAHDLIEKLKTYKPLEKQVDMEAAARMPGWVDYQKWLEHRAVDKLSGHAIPKALWAEYEALGGDVKGAGGVDAMRAATQQMVRNQLRNSKVSALVPELFLREYHRLGEEAASTAAKAELRTFQEKNKNAPPPEPTKPQGTAAPASPTVVPSALAQRHWAKIQAELANRGGTIPADEPPGQPLPRGASKPMSEGGQPTDMAKQQAARIEQQWLAQAPPVDPELGPGAAELKRRQIVAFEGWRLARQTLEDQAKFNAMGLKMRDDFTWRADVEQAGKEHLAAVDGALEAYGFVKPEQPQMNPIDKYVTDQINKHGADLVFDPELKGRALARQQLGAMSVDQLYNAQRFLQSLRHYIEQVDTFAGGMVPKKLAPLVESLAHSMSQNWPKLDRSERSKFIESVAKSGRALEAAYLNMEFTLKMLDGSDPHGLLNRTIFQPIVEGEGRKFRMMKEVETALSGYIDELEKGKLAGASSLKVRDNKYIHPITGKEILTPGRRLTKAELGMALTYFGTETGRKALLKGYGISADEFLGAVQRDLPASAFEFVNRYWKLHEAVFPEVQKTYRQRNGVDLEGVKPTPFTLTDAKGATVEMTGGYSPLKYSGDAANVHGLYNVQGFESPDLHFRDDFTESRQGSFGPLELNPAVVLGNVSQKVHYATLYNPVQEANKIISHPRFREMVSSTLGPEFNDTLFDGLRRIARDGMPMQPLHAWDRLMRWAMKVQTTATIGMNLPVAYLQVDQLIPASMELRQHMLPAAKDLLTDWNGTWKRALEQSNELMKMGEEQPRWKIAFPVDVTVSVPLVEKLKTLGDGNIIRNAKEAEAWLREVGMAHHLHVRQFAGVWMFEAAKLKAIEAGRPDPVAFADAIVRQFNGGTGIKDMSKLMGQPGLARATTMFFSQMSLIGNHVLTATNALKAKGVTRETLAGMTVALAGFVAMPTLLRMFAKREDVDMQGLSNPDIASYIARAQIGLTCTRAIPVVGDPLGELIAPDRPGEAFSGPIGSEARSVRQATLGTFSDRHEFNARAVTKVLSYARNVPLDQIYRNVDFLVEAASGTYGHDLGDLYRVYQRGPKKEGYR